MSAELGIVISLVGLAGTVIAALWRVGSVGKTIGTTLTMITARLDGHDKRIGDLEEERRKREAEELAALRAEVARLKGDG